MSKDTKVRRRCHYKGRVQGVGFRYTTQRIASRFDVVGYVRNMPDGSVELEAEGTMPEVDTFLEAVNEELGGYIRESTASDIPATSRDTSFSIRF